MWQRTRTPLLVGPHTRAICERLDRAIEDYRNGESTFLMVQVPFRHGKSDLVSRYLPPRFMGLFPDDDVIVAAYAASLVCTFARFGRMIVRDPKYRNVFPGMSLSRETQSVNEWGLEGHLGKSYWVGLGGSITGKGGSLILIDDFFKSREEAESEVIREKVWDSIRHDILTRRAPVAIVIILATPWHPDDPFGRIRKEMAASPDFPRFEEHRFPAWTESEIEEDENGRPKRIFLFPERFSELWYRSQEATLGTYGTASLLQCDPVPKLGNLFRVDKVQIVEPEEMPTDIVYTRGWDLASSEKQRVKDNPDYTVGVKLGIKWHLLAGTTEKVPVLYISDVVRGRWQAPQRDKIIKSTALADGAITVGVEAFGAYKDAYVNISQALTGLRMVKKLQLAGDKVSKWSPLEPIFEAGNVYMARAAWNQAFLDELRAVPGAAHDDQADALSVAYHSHDPYTVHVWGDYQVRPIPYKVNFRKLGVSSTLVISQWVDEDLTTSMLFCLWNAEKGHLCVFDELLMSTAMAEIVVSAAVQRVREVSGGHINNAPTLARAFEWYGNPAMFARQASSTTSRSDKDGMWSAYQNIGVNLQDNPWYDELGSVLLIAQLMAKKRILFHSRAAEAYRQVGAWAMDKGRPAPGYGFCRALCNTASMLHESGKMGKVEKALPSYSPQKEHVQRSIEDAERQGRLGEWVQGRKDWDASGKVPDSNSWMGA
jgi:predicted phage terminase large subunit-like protein